MCVAIPGKVVDVNDGLAKVDFSGNIVEARSGLVDVEPGEYVLVHAGCILQKVSAGEAEDLQQLFNDLGSFADGKL